MREQVERIVFLSSMLIGLIGCKAERSESRELGSQSEQRQDEAGDLRKKSGYGSHVSDGTFFLCEEERRGLLLLARTSVEAFVRTGVTASLPEELGQRFPQLVMRRACFVTLRKQGDLRGCIGSLEPRRSLLEDVRQNAISAAIYDTRFKPVQEGELGQLVYEISVLDLPKVLEGVTPGELPAYLREHKPGVIVEYEGRRSTFLPSVWEDLPDPDEFLVRLCKKQGSSGACWRESAARISTYNSIHFSETDEH